MTRKKQEYERVGGKAARGEYTLVVPLDYYLLEQLQPEGTMFAGLYEIGTTISEISKQERFKELPQHIVSGRVRTMALQGLTKKIRSLGSANHGAAWQRTELGTKILNEWKEANGHG